MVDGDGVRRLIEDLTGEALKDLLRNLRNHSEVQRRILAGELSQQEVNSTYVRYAREHSSQYRRMVGDLTADYYRELTQLSSEYSERFYRMVLDRDGDYGESESGQDGGPETVPLELHGRLGSEVVSNFRIENSDPTPAAVTLEPGWCRGPDGQPFTAPLSIQPASLVVPAGGSATVSLRLALLASTFEPGTIYRLPISVQGPRPMAIDARVWVEEPDAPDHGYREPPTAHWQPTAPSDDRGPADKEEKPAKPRGDTTRRKESVKPPDREQPTYKVECPVCHRVFERKTEDLRLRPHKNEAGDDCRGRNGFRPE